MDRIATSGLATCSDCLRRGEANRMTKGSLIEGKAGTVVTVCKIVKAGRYTQIEVGEREEGHERDRRSLGGELTSHRRADAAARAGHQGSRSLESFGHGFS